MQMPLNGLFNLLRLNSDIPLGHRCRAVLEKLLHQSDVIAAVPIYLGGGEFSAAIGTHSRDTQLATHQLELLLYSPL